MKPVDIESHVRQVAWPEPPADLRARVLAAAPVSQPAVSWSDRVWFSRAWRFAAAATVVALIALEQLAGPGVAATRTVAAPIREDIAGLAEAAREAGLSAGQADVLARRMVSAAERPRANAAFRELGIVPFEVEGEMR